MFKPQDHVDEKDLAKGLKLLMYDGAMSTIMGSLTGGAFLVTFALLLGASNLAIGVIAAAAPLSQIMQIPAILLIEKIRSRKRIVVIAATMGRMFLFSCALLPWFPYPELRIPLFVLALFLYNVMGSISGCAWNTWMHDLIPQEIMGRFFGKRLAVSTAFAAVLSLGAGVMVDRSMGPGGGTYTYSLLFFVGSFAGFWGVFALSKVPEPKMVSHQLERLFPMMKKPFKDKNYRRLIIFLATWNFAVNLAAPFYTVYMIKELGMSLGWIIGLSVMSQGINVLFFNIWGKLADRFSNKSCLTVAGPLFIIGIGLWPFLTMPEPHILTIPLIILIHALSGISTAGVTLCSSNIALKSAPKGQATVFLATNALVNGIAACIAPILAGALSDYLQNEQLKLDLVWHSIAMNSDRFNISALDFKGTDFLFVFAFIVGLYAIHRLLAVTEVGDVEERIVITELYHETRHALRSVANVAGIRHMTYFPYAIVVGALDQSKKSLHHIRRRVRRPPRPQHRRT
ncbi:MAG: MFS transporter [Proteobacteria bacterium]|nr:MAG: MFS transporter [Pseudomonadota bacterium]